MARPKSEKEDIKEHPIMVRMTEKQHKELKAVAGELGLTLASYLLSAGIEKMKLLANNKDRRSKEGE